MPEKCKATLRKNTRKMHKTVCKNISKNINKHTRLSTRMPKIHSTKILGSIRILNLEEALIDTNDDK
ncbi:16012_t:CDS:1, partial [Dentiscutata erythropus]